MHGGTNLGASKGDGNAWKHGGRSAETMKAVALAKALAQLVKEIDCWAVGCRSFRSLWSNIPRCIDAPANSAISGDFPMSKRLTPYGSTDQAANIAKVGKNKTPQSLVARMPSAELAAKVGGTPMPSPSPSPSPRVQLRRVERLNSRV